MFKRCETLCYYVSRVAMILLAIIIALYAHMLYVYYLCRILSYKKEGFVVIIIT